MTSCPLSPVCLPGWVGGGGYRRLQSPIDNERRVSLGEGGDGCVW